MKKLLSIILSAAISTTLFSGIVTANADTVTYEIGDRPYAENGISTEPIVTTGDGVKFYDDFFVKMNMDTYTEDDLLTNTRLELKKQTQNSVNNEVTSTVSIESGNENVYGGTGQSYKLNYTKYVSSATPQGSDMAKSYVNVRFMTTVGSIDYFNAPDLALAFWVQTEKPVYIAVRCLDNNDGSDADQRLISKEILIPEGESIVEIPFAHMAVERTGYDKNAGSTNEKMRFTTFDFLIRSQYKAEGDNAARDIYIDNIGYYLVASNGDKTAEHKINAVSKMGDISGYTQVEGNAKQVQRTSGGTVYKWKNLDDVATSISACGTDDKTENANAYKKAGQSICYTTNLTQYSGIGYNAFNTTETFYLSDNYSYFWGSKATIAIWVKSSRALKIYAEATDITDGINGTYMSSTYIIPAGESILRIPVSDFNTFKSGTENENCAWRGVHNFALRFSAVNSTALNFNLSLSRNTTLYIDALRVECPRIGDSSEDGRISLVDLVKLKKFIANNDATADITLYDVGSDNFDDKGFALSDGVVDGLDLSIFRQYLLGKAKVSVAPFTAKTLAVSTLSSWGFDK